LEELAKTKLVLGTVQLGLNYGINNSSGKPSQKDIFGILDLAHEQKIESLVLLSDKKLLRQIFINLISNAVKYTDPQKNVYITLEHQPDLTIFMVEDEGIGIPEDDFSSLFEPFMRSKNIGKIKGTGLGLSILKRAIDLLGGRVDFSSAVGIGSTFTVYIPDHILQTTSEEVKDGYKAK
jgi:signal transduction histidine kinase